MSSPDLQRQIAALTAALAQSSTVDQPTRALLGALHTQVARLTDHDTSIAQRLEALAVRFEADHPTGGHRLAPGDRRTLQSGHLIRL